MIQLDDGPRRFNYRIAGVAIHGDAVLLHQADGDSFWTVPGGRAEHGETAEQTIKREMLEELETEIDVDRLLWVVENFFDHGGLSYHELALYFLIRFPDGSAPRLADAFDRADGSTLFHFKWVPLERHALDSLPVYPAFLSRGLTDLPRSVVHIVEADPSRRTRTNGSPA